MKRIVISGCVLFLCALVLYFFWIGSIVLPDWFTWNTAVTSWTSVPCVSAGPAGRPTSELSGIHRSPTILFVGDTSFGESYGSGQAVLREKGYDYPLERFETILQGADCVIANFESTLCYGQQSNHAGRKPYIHADNPVRALPAFFRHNMLFFSMGNNHSMDYGLAGLGETLSHFQDEGFHVFGAGKTAIEAAKPLFLDIPLQDRVFKFAIIGGFEYRLAYDFRYSFYARHGHGGVLPFTPATIVPIIRKLRREDPDRHIILFPQWGDNYSPSTAGQRRLARRLIAAGGSLIIGHGAHQIQGMEVIDGQLCLYNIGNFMFNSPGRYGPDTTEKPPWSFVTALSFPPAQTERATISLKLYPIFTDNKRTGYQSRFLDRQEFAECSRVVRSRNERLAELMDLHEQTDEYGRHFAFRLSTSTLAIANNSD